MVAVGVRVNLNILRVRCALNGGYLGWLFGGFADRCCGLGSRGLFIKH